MLFRSCEHIGYNRWDATNKANVASDKAYTETGATVKTIYDPCPPGWCVPPVGAFYAFTSAGGATKYDTPMTKMSTAANGDNTPAFRVKANASTDIGIKLPITGDRSRYYGAPWWTSLADRNVQLWTATPTTVKKTISGNTYTYTTCAFFVSSGANYFNKLDDGGLAKSSGFAVLPVKE